MANPFCSVNGIMNAVEFDVGNFRKWLAGTVPGGTGPQVEFTNQNGYLVYFSDRRGMIGNPHPGLGGLTNGEYGSKMSSTPPQRPALRMECWSRLRTWTKWSPS